MLETVYHCLTFGIFSTLGVLLLTLWRAVYDQQFDFHLWAAQRRRTPAPSGLSSEAIQLVQRAVQMLQGDKEAFVSLLADQYVKHPDRSDVWVLQKVIHDLERDRH
jgi:hypothetical protein